MEPLGRDERRERAGDEWQLASSAREVSDVSVPSFLRAHDPPRSAWVDPDGVALAGAGTVATLTASGPARFDAIREQATRLFATGDAADAADVPAPARPRLVGGFAFHDEHEPTPPWNGFPSARFVLPAVQFACVDGTTWLTANEYGPDATAESAERTVDDLVDRLADRPADPRADAPGVADTSLQTSRAEWNDQITTAVDRIEAGHLSKVALAQTRRATTARSVSVPDVLARLAETYPNCYRFFVEPTDESAFFGATPEQLVSLRGRTVETEALAGSASRGETLERDDALAADLRDSAKVDREHQLVADAIREHLAPLAASVTTSERTIRKLANVQHLETPISAELDGGEHVLSVVEALHPTPAVGGLPQREAHRVIRQTEAFDRGWYASPVGWFDAAGDGTFSVGIRSGLVTRGDERDEVTLFAGNGIVADSDPAAEWDEVQLKYQPLLDALREDE